MGSSSLLAVVLLAGASFPGVPDSSQVPLPSYTIIDLGTLGGLSSVGLGLNNRGQVCGGADRSDGLRHAFLWTNGTMIDLGSLSNDNLSEAWDVNNLGQVVGVLSFGFGGFLWEDGQMIDIGNFTGTPTGQTSAFAINDAGQIVGTSRVSITERHAFLWEDGVMTDLTANGFGSSAALDINSAGQVVGGQLIWDRGTLTDLGTLGGAGTGSFGINDRTQVVGWSERVSGQGDLHPFLWDTDEMIDLGGLGSTRGQAINNCGQIVIFGNFFFFPQQGLGDLGDLLPPGSGWFDLLVRDINDAGQIVGDGTFNGRRRAFLMTPADCNGNGVLDADDIASGTSLNANGNLIPDECELDSDGDGVIDRCDGCPDDSNKVVPGRCGCGNIGEADSDEDGVPDCTDKCPGADDTTFAPECEGAVPAVSQWGLITLALLLLVIAKIYFSCAGKT